ncbi:hypothetical protein IWQ56_001245 [Coemansia nantahalensis]|uniref:Uncharacterized protein n=2 Tax=Coemansia TaxID=4863 RepID=A0ACC1L5E8_9FUNG|nr:hypothetical protein IWQ56_001245 [Coemansia nantahalensis]KAJ2773771.1 hypothetical protein IWQ57_001134 [Coemansia nantahalensis]KAJ2801313.1 hypothetical protein H4R21_002833 [Coemansia helicoidea]
MKCAHALALGAGLLAAHAHQGCNVETAVKTLLGKATIDHVSEALLQNIQRDVGRAINDVEHAKVDWLADQIVDRYRVLRGVLGHVGIALPMI